MNPVTARFQPTTSLQTTNRQDVTPLGAIRNPQIAGQLAAPRLNEQDKDAFLAVLDRMQVDGIHELDFSALSIGTEGMQCMADAFAERLGQGKHLGIAQLNFSNAELGSPVPLVNVLRQHAGGGIEAIDFSGAYDREPAQDGLSNEALTAITGLPNKNQALLELKLNRQPGLASSLANLTTAVQSSALMGLGLSACGLSPEAWQHLKTCIGKDSALTRLDLRGNDNMASTQDPDPFLLFLLCVNKNKSLVEVHLPAPATEWYEAGIKALPNSPVKNGLSLEGNASLRVLTPLSASNTTELLALNQQLNQNRWRYLEPKLVLAACLDDPFRVPVELRQKIAALVERIPPTPLQ